MEKIIVRMDTAYNHGADSNWKHKIVLTGMDNNTPHVDVESYYGPGSPSEIALGKDVSLGLIPDGVCDTQQYREYLERPETQKMLWTIYYGYTFEDGKGILNPKAYATASDIDTAIENIDAPAFMQVETWFNVPSELDADIRDWLDGREDVDEALGEMAAHLEKDALDQDIYLDEDEILEFLKRAYEDKRKSK